MLPIRRRAIGGVFAGRVGRGWLLWAVAWACLACSPAADRAATAAGDALASPQPAVDAAENPAENQPENPAAGGGRDASLGSSITSDTSLAPFGSDAEGGSDPDARAAADVANAPDASPGPSDTDLAGDLAEDLADLASGGALDSGVASDTSLVPFDGDAVADGGGPDIGPALDAGVASDTSLVPDAAPASDAAADAGPATSADVASADLLLPPADQPGANVKVALSTSVAGLSGTLMVTAVNAAALVANGGAPSFGTPLWQGPLPALPASVWVTAPPGDWGLAAMVVAPGSTVPVAGGLTCGGGKPQPLSIGAIPQQVTIDLVASAKLTSIKALCEANAAAPAVLISEQSDIQTPPTAQGGAHFMNALVHGDRLWVAGSQDGYVSFDFPGGATITTGLAGWTIHGGPVCNRVARVGDRLFCSSRAAYLQILQLGANQSVKKLQQVWLPVAGGVTEGLAAQQGLLYVAAHKAGIAALHSAPPFSPQPLTLPPGLDEAWDVAALGTSHLALAQGSKGLAILDVGGANSAAPQPIALLKLPGVAAYLHAQGGLIAVGAMGGGLHLVDVATPSQPKLRASLASPTNVYGVALLGEQVFAAAGSALLAADVPALADGAPLRLRGSLVSKHFAVDVDPHLGGLLTAEFQSVRRVAVDLAAPKQVPVLIAPVNLGTAIAAVGDPMTLALRLHNAGAVALNIHKIEWFETKALDAVPQQFKGPWQIAPGASLPLSLTVKKLAKGVLDHAVMLHSDDPVQPQLAVRHVESTWLQVGDSLPELPVYKDAQGATLKVSSHLKGQVGVVLVAAQSCPVAFQALAAASVDLAPLVASKQIAAVAINPWDQPQVPEAAAFDPPFPVVYSGLTTSDGHDWSQVLDVELGQPILNGPPMPIVYIVGKDGKIVLARWGYDTVEVLGVLQALLAKP